jgi:hypothetical protein
MSMLNVACSQQSALNLEHSAFSLQHLRNSEVYSPPEQLMAAASIQPCLTGRTVL